MTIGGFATPRLYFHQVPGILHLAAALSLVIAAGSELFTGNNMVLAAAS